MYIYISIDNQEIILVLNRAAREKAHNDMDVLITMRK